MPAVRFRVNGEEVTVDADPSTPLLWVLRDHLGLSGTKYGCGVAQCGACTVHLDGRAARSCVAPLESVEDAPPPMKKVRKALSEILVSPRLSRMRSVETVMQWFDREDVTTHALLELIGFALVHDTELKYRLLAEASPIRRAKLIRRELWNLDHLVEKAERQNFKSWPKGMSWN